MWEKYISESYMSVKADETISKALSSIKKAKQVLVFKGNNFKGVVTRKNLLRSVGNLSNEKVSKVMITPPYVTKDLSDQDIGHLFIQSGLHKLVVFNDKDIVGIIKRVDFLEHVVSNKLGKNTIESIANKDVNMILPKDSLAKALSRFRERGVSKLVVFDNKLRGVISLTNILSYFSKTDKISPHNLKNTLVKDVMKNNVYTISETDSIRNAIDLFSKNNVSSLVVKTKKNILNRGHVFGIITKTDILTRYLSFFKGKKFNINIVSKIKNLDKNVVEKKFRSLEKILDKGTSVFVYLKQGKEKFRGLPLVNCRLRIVMPGVSENVSVEGWGIEHAIELAVTKIKRRLTENLFEFTKSRS